MPKSLDLIMGIMMALTGLYCFACLPIVRKRCATLQAAGKITSDEIKSKIKILKLTGWCSLIVGSGSICIYLFGLY